MGDRTNLVHLERRGSIAVLTLDRPPVNAFSQSLQAALLARVEEIDVDLGVNVVVLTAAGSKAFCAGADLHELRGIDAAERRVRHENLTRTWRRIAELQVPAVCAIQSAAIGAGTVLASLCDYRIAADAAVFSYPEIDRGTVGGGGVFLRRTGVKPGAIREILFTGRRFSATEALTLNIVDRVVTLDQLLPNALELAGQMAEKSREALVLTKRAIRLVEAEPDWIKAYEATHPLSAEATRLGGATQRIDAFLKSRG